MKDSRSEFIPVRGLRYHIRHWGAPDAPLLVMLHGWMDVSASFQFVVDCLPQEWHVIAPDWRGFGLTDNSGADTYWFADYLADLDAILEHYAPKKPVALLGHSMGGNIACLYAGVRPERIRALINLEGFGMPVTAPEQAPARYAAWLKELREPAGLHRYPTQVAVAARLQKNNPRLSDARAAFLSAHWARQAEDGQWEILGDPVHKRSGPILYRIDEVTACLRAITAPVFWVEAAETAVWQWLGPKARMRQEIDRRMGYIARLRSAVVADAGHMLHHDQPEVLATLLEEFLHDNRNIEGIQ